eukprot:TRINITY_DN42813_c0_g1_i1.p1 TRINITY_DN42813_c0_g1~~TRINITY_DN42813_c0_g1_i1.p1  ORF type:complete len:216 (+),score=6.02 TRINITY_DN42813_c0_g1_i1:86-649(+)
MQELPEDSPPGQLPRSLEVILEDDLVDSCKPGDRVTICGIYRAISTKASGQITGLMRSVLIGNTVKKFSKLGTDTITTSDLRNFKSLSQEEDCLDQLANSLAPSIYGHDWVKKAIVLLLVGGQEKKFGEWNSFKRRHQLSNGWRSRCCEILVTTSSYARYSRICQHNWTRIFRCRVNRSHCFRFYNR